MKFGDLVSIRTIQDDTNPYQQIRGWYMHPCDIVKGHQQRISWIDRGSLGLLIDMRRGTLEHYWYCRVLIKDIALWFPRCEVNNLK